MYLHEHSNFKDLIEITSSKQKIHASLVEKDYWIMNVLHHLSKLFNFQMKGGTSLSKGFQIVDRFSEDIDLQIEPQKNTLDFKVYYGKNHDKEFHIESRKKYFEHIKNKLQGKIHGIESTKRDYDFDDAKFRNAGIRLSYQSVCPSLPSVRKGVLLELGFGNVTPNTQKDISSWIFDEANLKTMKDNRAKDISCYNPEYTFVEKMDAITRKYDQYKKIKKIPQNFLRHYYDLYCLLNQKEIQNFIGTKEYQDYKKENLKMDSTVDHPAFLLKDSNERKLFEKEYKNQESLYYKGQIDFSEILKKISESAKNF